MHNLSNSMAFDSLIPLSTTLASSMEFSSGGPGSNVGEANGTSSAFTVKTPSFGVSENGCPISIFVPTITSVFPNSTLAEPSARSIIPCSTFISRYSVKALPSKRFPFAISCAICFCFTRVIMDDITPQPP